MAKRPEDSELNFLHTCSREELEPLVGAILGTDDNGNISKTGRMSSTLNKSNAFKAHFPDHTMYVDGIIEEIQRYGGNTLVNIFRGCGVSYHETLVDVAKKMGISCSRVQTTNEIEDKLLTKVLSSVWSSLSDDDRNKIIKELGLPKPQLGGMGAAAAVAFIMAQNTFAYPFIMSVAGSLGAMMLGRAAPVILANAGLGRILAILGGPIGWAIAGVWSAFDIAAPAYRITIPVCIYVAALRKMKSVAPQA